MNCLYCKKEIQEGSAYCNWCGRKQTRAKPKHRRANGSGSVSKLAGKRAKPWRAMANAVTVDGQMVRHLIGTYATRTEAENAIVENRLLPASAYKNVTLAELWSMYKESKKYNLLSDNGRRWTDSGYAKLSDLYTERFADIRNADFQKCIDKYEHTHSRSSLSAIRSVAVTLSDYALSLDIVPHSYAAKLILPKPKKKKKEKIFTDDEIRIIMDADGHWEDTIKVLLYTGMRINEALSIKVEDIRDGLIYCGGTKTDAAERIIPISDKIADVIQRLSTGKYLFSGDKRIRDDTYRKEHYYPTLQKLGVSKLRPHSCRRWFFSKLDEYCDDKVAMAFIGGHTDPAFTQRTYVTTDIERLKNVIKVL